VSRGPVTGVFTVLIIEDMKDTADSLAMYLNLVGGFRTVVAYDGKAGVETALRVHPDAVVCDLAMPGKDGLTVAEELNHRMAHRPCLIAVSAFSDSAMRRRAHAAGFDHYLVKPAHPEDIKRLLQTDACGSIGSREAGSRA
jgi:two-component system, sensor histidine kinase